MTDPYGSPPSGPSDREREGSFEAIASWYDGRMGDEGDGTHRHLLLPALSRALGDVAGLSALDLGCAGGVCGRLLAKRGARVVGLDLSPSLVALARSREETQPRGIGYLVADAASLPFPSARFSRVVAHMVLMDAEDAAGIIREAARVLAPVAMRGVLALELLKHELHCSDEQICSQLRTDLAVMYACGITEVQVNRSQEPFVLPELLTQFRSRLDESLLNELLALQAAKSGRITDELRDTLNDNVPIVFATIMALLVPVMAWLAIFKP